MDILGIGGWELVAIFIIMLVVAGPKRMIQWSYTLGKYVAQLRKMWADTAQMLQKEFDEAGVDVKVPTNIPTRGDLNREIGRALTPVTKPLQETMDATKSEINSAKKTVSFDLKPADTAKPAEAKPEPVAPAPAAEANPEPAPTQPAAPVEQQPAAPEAQPAPKPEPKPEPSTNGRPAADFGTWSQKSDNGA